MKIYIENRQKRQRVEKLKLRKVARRILNVSGCPEAELSLVIVDDDEIRTVNRDYLGRDKTTNVISFSMQEGEGAGVQPNLLGDIIISADTAARDAAEAGISYEGELYFLLLHGILHLLGFDHERGTEEEAIRMEEREREIYSVIEKEFLAT